MTRALMLLAALLAASPVGALTCAPVDPAASFRRADAAPERFHVLLGTMAFDDSALPPPVAAPAPPVPAGGWPDVPARLTGVALEPRGTLVETGHDLLIRPSCAGPWCGWIPSGETWLVFAREEGDALVVEVGPCGGWVFMDPTEAQVAAVRACMDQAGCSAP